MMKQRIFSCCSFCAVLLVILMVTTISLAEEKPGKILVEKKCTICHSIDRVYSAKKKHPEWKQTVEKMMRYSDQMNFLNQKEKETVIEFLANRKIKLADSEQ